LVVVDVHRPSQVLSQELLKKAQKVAVIDHHRRGEEFVNNAVFDYVDPNASSTCEILSELIKDSPENVYLRPEIATFMLTGIILDTDFFKRSTEARTLDAVVFLKEHAGDLKKATENLKDELEEVLLINKILAKSYTPFYGIMVSTYADEKSPIDRAVLSKVADMSEEIKGIDASFVIGNISTSDVGISARSNPSFNVQVILEKMGGGGHFTSAGAQFKNSSVDEVKKQLLDVLVANIEQNRRRNV
jgi:c-di-AMP phosphodiesterase-like protein